jgi:hypothetical protein
MTDIFDIAYRPGCFMIDFTVRRRPAPFRETGPFENYRLTLTPYERVMKRIITLITDEPYVDNTIYTHA